jgi:hypothetical protein
MALSPFLAVLILAVSCERAAKRPAPPGVHRVRECASTLR